MKRINKFLACAAVAFMAVSCGGNQANVEAPAVDKGKVLAEILNARKSIRQFDTTKTVSDKVIMDILWTANGVNREDGKRTAPSAVNAQDIQLYVCKSGVQRTILTCMRRASRQLNTRLKTAYPLRWLPASSATTGSTP